MSITLGVGIILQKKTKKKTHKSIDMVCYNIRLSRKKPKYVIETVGKIIPGSEMTSANNLL